MTLADRIATSKTKGGSNQGLNCSVADLLATLPPDEAEELRGLLSAPWRVVPHASLERAILAEGHEVGKGTVGKHRRGDCRCSK